MKNTKKKAVLQEYKTLEDIKQEFLDEYKQNDVLYQKDVMDAVEHLAMTDTDFDDLFQWFSDNDIEVKNEDGGTVKIKDGEALAECTAYGVAALVEELCQEVISDRLSEEEKKI